MPEKTFTIPLDIIPEAKKWKNGEAYELEVVQIGKDAATATFKLTWAGTEDDEEAGEDEGDQEDGGEPPMYDRMK